MIEKVLVIVYKIKGDQPLFFIGCRPKTGLCQPITGHKDEGDKDVAETVRREVGEEIGVSDYRNFINLKEKFNWKKESGETVEESVFAVEVEDKPLKIEKREFAAYEFLPVDDAIKKVKFESHGKYLKKVAEVIRTKNYPKIFAIIGPGGSGKGTIIEGVTSQYGEYVRGAATATTRPKKKPGEVAKYRIFLTENEFKNLDKEGKLIEKNFFKGNWYGAPKEEVYKILGKGKNVIIEVDLNGLKSFRKVFSNVVSIFIDAHTDVFRQRMTKRGMETPEEIKERMKITEWELQNKHLCDYIIENREGKPQEAVKEVIKIIEGKRSNMKNPTTIIIFIVLIGLVLGGILLSSPPKSQAPTTSDSQTKTNKDILGQFEGFNEYSYEIQKQDGKPVVYLFSTTTCPHCEWIKDTFDKWAKENSDKIVAYHWQLDNGDNTLTEETEIAAPQEAEEIFAKFNPERSVPTFVFGGKYERVGNAFEQEGDLNKEVEIYNKVVNKLLGN